MCKNLKFDSKKQCFILTNTENVSLEEKFNSKRQFFIPVKNFFHKNLIYFQKSGLRNFEQKIFLAYHVFEMLN